MKYAILSDIHGNFPAMQLAMEDALHHGADGFLFVGDYCVNAPWLNEVTQALQDAENSVVIRGNEEKYLHISDGEDGQFEISRWCGKNISKAHLQYLDDLPERADFVCENVGVHMAHSSEAFIGRCEIGKFDTKSLALRYGEKTISRQEALSAIQNGMKENARFPEYVHLLEKGVYIFGHTHSQWHMEVEGRWFVNPGSCGLPVDCMAFGAPYTMLTLENGQAQVEEYRVPYDPETIISQVKASPQYAAASVWCEVIFEEWRTCREKINFFLEFAEHFAVQKADPRRPFARDTWRAAHEAWKKKNTLGRF